MSETYKNSWDAIYDDDPGKAAIMKIKSDLMVAIEKNIKALNLTQQKAAELLNVTQPRISDLVRGKMDNFTIDSLISMLVKIGAKVNITQKEGFSHLISIETIPKRSYSPGELG